MFEEGQLYSPVTENDDGSVTVHLAPNHPGVDDPEYLRRRGEIAKAAMEWTEGTPAPVIEYTESEQEVWRIVCRELQEKHARLAHSAYIEAWDKVKLPTDRIPQLEEVTAAVRPLTGFHFHPAPGLVPLLQFYGSLEDKVFHSTQYLRHAAEPLYTPEPDLIHEIVGHGVMLGSPYFSELHRLTGQAARRLETRETLDFLAKVFWFTCEFGVIMEKGELKTYGAGLLSSYGEIQQVADADLRPLDVARMGVQTYDITHYQPILFCAEGFGEVEDVVGGFFDEVDDDLVQRLAHEASTPA